jgi:hypothetical protein
MRLPCRFAIISTPPVSKKASWEGFHGMWPASIVQQLRKQLPPGYVAEPRVHLGTLRGN